MSRGIGATIVLILLMATHLVAHAQEPPATSPAGPSSSAPAAVGKKILGLFGKSLHPIVKSVGPGGGFGPGIAYEPKQRGNEPWSYRFEGVVTPRLYWNAQSEVWSTWNRFHAEAYARAREMTRLDFYGIGSDTSRDSRTSFRFSDRTVGGLISALVVPAAVGVRIGGRIEGLWPDIGPGRAPDVPSIEEVFTETEAPGLTTQPPFAAYSGFVTITYPDNLNQLGRHGADARIDYNSYKDRGDGRYDFGRLTTEFQQRLPALRPSHLLTLHQLFSTTTTSGGHAAPFYLQQTLGGAGAVRALHEDILGSDSTKATLRGFEDLRFRGPHVLLLQVEYRLKVYGPIDATLFVDGGKATALRSDLNLSGLKHNYGLSLSVMTAEATAVRLDVGGGGGEGVHLFFSFGPIFSR